MEIKTPWNRVDRGKRRLFPERLRLPDTGRIDRDRAAPLLLPPLPASGSRTRQYPGAKLALAQGSVPVLPVAHIDLVFPGWNCSAAWEQRWLSPRVD
jgi:hypothetical protein